MRIAILSRYQQTAKRGVESVVSELVSYFSKEHEVTLLVGSDSDSFKKIISGNFDVVMPMNGRIQSLKASIGRLFGGYKLVIGGHSGVGRDDLLNILFRPDVFIALTNYMANWARKWAFGVRVVKINNGVDLDKFNPNGDKIDFELPRPIFLSVGALVPYKRHELAINAVASLEKGSLVVIGEGDEQVKLTELASRKLAGRFKILSLPYDKMPQAYRGCDVFTLPSWDREAFGVVYLEAMASNRPVVAPNDPSRREIVGDGGVLVNVTSCENYASALNEAGNKDWGNRPRLQAEKFSWEKIGQDYVDCFRGIVKNA